MRKFCALTLVLCIAASVSKVAAQKTWVKQVIVSEYRAWYIRNDSTIWTWNSFSTYPVQFPIGGRKAVQGAGAFNYFRVIDDQGYIWSSKTDVTTNTVRTDTDTTGAAFNNNKFVDAYGHVALTIRNDGSIWYFGKDEMSMFYAGGSMNNFIGTTMRPTKISPAGLTFKKALFGGNKIIALTTDGQVYIWYDKGGKTPTKMTIPRPATDIFVSHLDVTGCIIPDVAGQTMGYPYVFGTTTSMYGGGAPFTQFTSLKSMWKMTVPIKEIAASWNTIHFIDSLGRLWGCGFNSMGEVGNGQEFVNKYNYPGFPGYGWSFTDYENPSGIPVQVGVSGVKYKKLYSNNWFAYYKYAQDESDSIYSWGRNKALVLGNGFYNMQEQYSYDALDVLKPTMVHPLTAKYQQYNFTKPSISAGANQSITSSQTTLTGSVTAPSLDKNGTTAVNGINRVGYNIVSYKWTLVSGTGGVITSPNSLSTTVTGLTTGTYVFNLLTTDNNTGTLSANVTVKVTANSSTPPPTVGKVIPGRFEGENTDGTYSVQTQACSDVGGGTNVDYITLGSWMKYNVTVQTAGTYTVSFRVASANDNTGFVLKNAAGSTLATIKLLYNTGGYQSWATATTTVTLAAGTQTLQILSTSSPYWNLNWVDFALKQAGASVSSADVDATAAKLDATDGTDAPVTSAVTVYPNPVRDQFSINVRNAQTGTMSVQIIDQSGRVVSTRSFNKAFTDGLFTIPASDLTAGMYFIRMQIGSWTETKKLLKL